IASFAAIFAIGNPVAFDASAEDRDTRGFISITTSRPVSGCTANWMLHPPVSTPTSRSTAIPRSRIRWYSRSVSVIAGATVTLSPVCTPIGSTFSIEQTTTTLSWWSRISSSSYSFQPSTLSSISTSVTGLSARPVPAIRSTSSAVCAMPEPRPPIVKLGRITTGRPSSATAVRTSSIEWQTSLRGTSPPTARTVCLNFCRSSPRWIASMSAPIRRTPYLSRTPASCSATAVFSAVWPPRVGSSESGRSAPITSTCLMSSRLGTLRSDQLDQPIEQVVGVVRSGLRLRVVLHRERGYVEAPQSLDHTVVEADVAHLDRAELGVGDSVTRGVDRETVVVGGDLDLAGHPVHDRLVDAAVAVLELVRTETQGPAQHLVAEADPEQGNPTPQHLAGERHLDLGGRRVARPVGEEHRVRPHRRHVLDRRGRRQYVRGDAPLGHPARRVPLDPQVDRRDGQLVLPDGVDRVGRLRSDLADQIGALHRRLRQHPGPQ